MIKLERMNEAEFRASFDRRIRQHASSSARRGEWNEEDAFEASRTELEARYRQGLQTPNHVFAKVVDEARGIPVGEVYYTSEEQGGKVRFWVDWLTIEPEFRRQGFATQVLEHLARVAREDGADHMGLYVHSDNPGAIALYSKLGFRVQTMGMVRPLVGRSEAEAPPPG